MKPRYAIIAAEYDTKRVADTFLGTVRSLLPGWSGVRVARLKAKKTTETLAAPVDAARKIVADMAVRWRHPCDGERPASATAFGRALDGLISAARAEGRKEGEQKQPMLSDSVAESAERIAELERWFHEENLASNRARNELATANAERDILRGRLEELNLELRRVEIARDTSRARCASQESRIDDLESKIAAAKSEAASSQCKWHKGEATALREKLRQAEAQLFRCKEKIQSRPQPAEDPFAVGKRVRNKASAELGTVSSDVVVQWDRLPCSVMSRWFLEPAPAADKAKPCPACNGRGTSSTGDAHCKVCQ